MVLSTEYSEAVTARYTFQPLWVSDITKRGLFEHAGMYLVLSFYFVHILSFTAINDLFKYLRQNVEALEFTEVDVLNLAGKYGLG